MGNAPKLSQNVNEQIRPGGKAFFDAEALAIKSHLTHRSGAVLNGDEKENATNGQAVVEEDKNHHQMRTQKEEEAIQGIQEEWEVELTKLTAKFERDLQMKTKNKEDQKVLTLKYTKEKDKFEKNMTLKREKKKESVTKKLLEHERAAAAALVEKQSEEMMNLIVEKKTKLVEDGDEIEDATSYP